MVGLDPKATEIQGASQEEVANWWPRVQRFFTHGHVPQVHDVNCPGHDGKTLVALDFRTDQPPYMVNVKGGDTGWIDDVIPWRDGSGTRTARRLEVLQLVLPEAQLPQIEIEQARMVIYNDERVDDHTFLLARLEVLLFVNPGAGQVCTLLLRKSEVSVLWGVDEQPAHKAFISTIGEKNVAGEHLATIDAPNIVCLESRVRLPGNLTKPPTTVDLKTLWSLAEVDSRCVPASITLTKTGEKQWSFNWGRQKPRMIVA